MHYTPSCPHAAPGSIANAEPQSFLPASTASPRHTAQQPHRRSISSWARRSCRGRRWGPGASQLQLWAAAFLVRVHSRGRKVHSCSWAASRSLRRAWNCCMGMRGGSELSWRWRAVTAWAGRVEGIWCLLHDVPNRDGGTGQSSGASGLAVSSKDAAAGKIHWALHGARCSGTCIASLTSKLSRLQARNHLCTVGTEPSLVMQEVSTSLCYMRACQPHLSLQGQLLMQPATPVFQPPGRAH